MQQADRQRDKEQQQWNEASFDVALADVIVAQPAGIDYEAFDLGILLGGAFHRLHAIQGFGEMGIHHAE